MERRILDYDPALKRTRYFHASSDGEEYAIESQYDVTDVIERNKALYAMTDEHAKWGEWAHVGSIPMSEYWAMTKDGVLDEGGICRDDRRLLKTLSDRDNLDFRVRPGRLI